MTLFVNNNISNKVQKIKWGCYALFILFLTMRCIPRYTIYASQSLATLFFCVGISGFVGLITNTIAIKMVLDYTYVPYTKIKIPYSGLLPNNISKIIKSLSGQIADQILTPDTIKQEIRNQGFFKKIIESIGNEKIPQDQLETFKEFAFKLLLSHINDDHFYFLLRDKIIKDYGMKHFALRLANATGIIDYDDLTYQIIDALKEKIYELKNDQNTISELADTLQTSLHSIEHDLEEEMLQFISDYIVNHFEVAAAVRNKLEDFSYKEIKDMVLELTNEHLGYIEIFGGILGSILGVVTWLAI